MKHIKKCSKILTIIAIMVCVNIFIFSYMPVNAIITANMLDGDKRKC